MTNREAFEAWYSARFTNPDHYWEYKPAAEAGGQAATKHQEALIALVYLESTIPSDAKAALRELCLRVAKEAVAETMYNEGEKPNIEAIVDKMLGEQQEIKPRDETQDLSNF